MSTGHSQQRDAVLSSFLLRIGLATALGIAAGVALPFDALGSGALAGPLVGGAIGFGVAGGLTLSTALARSRGLAQRIDELETRDVLTGLPNGRAMHAWLDHHLPHANVVQSHTALLVIHAEGLDRINESHGREIGDDLLMALVARVRSCLLGKDQLFRSGGTDLTVVRPDLAGTHAAEELAETILALLDNPYEIEGEHLRVPVCMGLAAAGGRPTTTADMLRDAEVATYRATTKGPGTLVRFEQAMVESLTPATAEHRLRRALERGDFQVTYMPIFSLTTGEVVEVEALLRWIDEGRGMVAADEFLTAMEQTGIIVPVGSWVVQEVCRQATYWARTFPTHRPVRVTANLSRRQLLQVDFTEMVTAALRDAEADPRRVILEVNERDLTDRREDLWGRLRGCKDLGVGISLDDLGAANSSLATLRRFQLDQVKIDHSFIETVIASTEDAAVVRHLTALCRELGIVTVAKAVQADDQARRLAELGVEHALGRYFSEPVTPGQIDELIYADLTRPARTAPVADVPAPVTAGASTAPVGAGPPPADLPRRTPGDPSAIPVEPARAEPVVVPDVAVTRRFPRRSSMLS